jgi:hypothetical protein
MSQSSEDRSVVSKIPAFAKALRRMRSELGEKQQPDRIVWKKSGPSGRAGYSSITWPDRSK